MVQTSKQGRKLLRKPQNTKKSQEEIEALKKFTYTLDEKKAFLDKLLVECQNEIDNMGSS